LRGLSRGVVVAHDKADLDKKIQCPLFVLWSEKGPFHRIYNVLQMWQDRAVQARGKAMPTGHFLPEQMPEELTQEITTFSASLTPHALLSKVLLISIIGSHVGGHAIRLLIPLQLLRNAVSG